MPGRNSELEPPLVLPDGDLHHYDRERSHGGLSHPRVPRPLAVPGQQQQLRDDRHSHHSNEAHEHPRNHESDAPIGAEPSDQLDADDGRCGSNDDDTLHFAPPHTARLANANTEREDPPMSPSKKEIAMSALEQAQAALAAAQDGHESARIASMQAVADAAELRAQVQSGRAHSPIASGRRGCPPGAQRGSRGRQGRRGSRRGGGGAPAAGARRGTRPHRVGGSLGPGGRRLPGV